MKGGFNMTELREIISKNFRKYRKQAKLSQTEMAKQLGISPSSVSNWEQGLNSIDIDLLFKACKILNVPISQMTETTLDYVVGNDEDMAILEVYKKLPSDQQRHLLAYAEFLSKEASKEHALKRHTINRNFDDPID
jgi:transcriptional regulator with XRE-family HTH domain